MALSWRLGQGPLDIGWAAPMIEDAISPPDASTRLRIGGASIQWRGFGEGAGRALDLHLRDVRVVDAGHTLAEVAAASIALSPGALLTGEVVPRDVRLAGLRLRMLRAADGTFSLDLGGLDLDALAGADGGLAADTAPKPSLTIAETFAALTRPAKTDGVSSTPPGMRQVEQLRSVRLSDVSLTLVDQVLGATVVLSEAELDLQRQPGGGVVGTGAAALAVGGAKAQLTLRAELAEGGTRVSAALSPVALAALASALPALAPAFQVDTAVELSAVATVAPTLDLRTLAVHAVAGGGRAALPAAELAFESMTLDATAEWDASAPNLLRRPDRVTLSRLLVVVASPAGGWDTTFGATGRAVRQADRMRADLALTVDHLAFADLPKLWPAAWGGNVRPWLVRNITAGTMRDGHVNLGLEAAADLSGLKLVAAGGTLQGDDVTIHWLRPVPPIERAQALLTLQSPDVIEIAIPSARQGAAHLTGGTVRITGLAGKDQALSVNANVAATVPDLLTLLRHPRLRLLDRHPIPARNPAGSLNGKLEVTLPLESNLDFSDVTIHAQGQLAGLRLGGLVAGRDLERGDIALDVTAEALKASGRGAIGGIPAEIALDMDFRSGPPSQVVQRATATGVATARQLAAAGLDLGGIMGPGVGNLTAAYQARRDGQGEVRIQADLRDAALALAGWKKAPGQPASASGRLVLAADKLQGISDIKAQGPGMQVRGRAEMVGNRPALLVLDPIVLGQTRGHGEIKLPTRPNEPIRATLAGTVLDISSELSRKPAGGDSAKNGTSEDKTPWVADINFSKVLLGRDRGLSAVTAHAEYDGRLLRVLQAQSTGPERLQAQIKPQGNGRQVSVRAANGGALLRAADLVNSVDGGQLALDGRYDDSGAVPILSGTADMRDFNVRDAPAVGKVLQALTIYGIAEAMSGPGLAFSQLTAPFRWDGELLDVKDVQAFSASLGLTAEGRIDTGRSRLDLKGTIVPAYALNSALGRIPLLGRLFSAEPGGGLVAVNYTLRGSPDDPTVSVNPLSALTPGFLRRLFRIFD